MTVSSATAEREEARLRALDRYDVLDTSAEEAFDRLTRIVRHVFDVPMATLTFVDGHRQWHKSRQGIDLIESDKRPAFCRLTIARTDPLVVTDTRSDERFRDNPLVLGPPHIGFYAGIPLRTSDGHNIGTLCAMSTEPRPFDAGDVAILTDLGRVAMDLLELQLQATTDALTGALMRRAFRSEGERALALAVRHRHDLSCLMLDLDHFKHVNDTYGHATGDAILRGCAEAIRAGLRTSDLLGRLGGEEFAVLLPMTDASRAGEVAERLREAVSRVEVATDGGTVRVTTSVGVAALDEDAPEIDTLLKRADEALYGAKSSGRNRCSMWRPLPDPAAAGRLRRVFKAGRIAFNAGRSTVDCTIRGLSDAGAALDVTSTAGIPDMFKLQIGSDELARRCRVLSKRDRHIDVSFA